MRQKIKIRKYEYGNDKTRTCKVLDFKEYDYSGDHSDKEKQGGQKTLQIDIVHAKIKFLIPDIKNDE